MIMIKVYILQNDVSSDEKDERKSVFQYQQQLVFNRTLDI